MEAADCNDLRHSARSGAPCKPTASSADDDAESSSSTIDDDVDTLRASVFALDTNE
jgi:hypothetical protein